MPTWPAGDHDELIGVSEADHRTDENIEDLIAAILTSGSGISITHNDGSDEISIASTVTSSTEASTTDDGSDVTEHRASADMGTGGASRTTLINITGSSGVLLMGRLWAQKGGNNNQDAFGVTVDGGAEWTTKSWAPSGGSFGVGLVPAVKFDTSLVVDMISFSNSASDTYKGTAFTV